MVRPTRRTTGSRRSGCGGNRSGGMCQYKIVATLALTYFTVSFSWQQQSLDLRPLQPHPRRWCNHRNHLTADIHRRSNSKISALSPIRMMSSVGDIIDVEAMWPALAGKQTCATSTAGKVIREAWAKERTHHFEGDRDGGRTRSGWTVRRELIEYKDGDTILHGLCVRPQGEGLPEKLPGVILAHTAVGPQEDFILWKLDSLAMAGYASFALDMFGTGRALWDRSESLAARRPLTEDRSLMQARANAALRTFSGLPGIDSDNIAAVGYCFGGMVVLDLARMGSPHGLKAVASLHGILLPIPAGAGKDSSMENNPIAPSILVLHASGDPFVPSEQVQAMEEEMSQRGANLEVVRYGGNARHAFTRPEKRTPADREAGLSYDEYADTDSWRRVLEMLREKLAP